MVRHWVPTYLTTLIHNMSYYSDLVHFLLHVGGPVENSFPRGLIHLGGCCVEDLDREERKFYE